MPAAGLMDTRTREDDMTATTLTAELVNSLTQQNDDIATAIERATDAAELEQAEKLVDFVADVWTALGYGYKLVELRTRLARRAGHLVIVEKAYIAGCRKNDRTLGSARTNLAKLEAML